LTVLHTPGHTRGGISLYCPENVMMGDTLFIGSVGRTDLPGGSLKQLVASVKEKLFTLPDETIVWPGYNYGSSTYSTINKEKQTNPFIK
jgi:hydroxyacylglutathione hydrolase